MLLRQDSQNERAKGVEYLDKDSIKKTLDLTDHGEVILAAGSLRTPPLLESSGIGDAAYLAGLRIEPRINPPGVGENLQEQANHAFILKGTKTEQGTPHMRLG